jgi:undecaprenyl-diphosphatase
MGRAIRVYADEREEPQGLMETFFAIDKAVFVFFNCTLANPVGDFLWPYITDYDRFLAVRIILVGIWLALMIKGGKRGRTAAVLVVLVIVCSDQLSSAVIKPVVQRPRPCHMVEGVPVVPDVHLLVGCGGGKSFPSSHAVNNFAVATLFAFFYPRARVWLFVWASLVALSRIAVGVHFPSDIIGGALIGSAMTLLILWLWTLAGRTVAPWMKLEPAGGSVA